MMCDVCVGMCVLGCVCCLSLQGKLQSHWPVLGGVHSHACHRLHSWKCCGWVHSNEWIKLDRYFIEHAWLICFIPEHNANQSQHRSSEIYTWTDGRTDRTCIVYPQRGTLFSHMLFDLSPPGKYGTQLSPLFLVHMLYVVVSVWACFRVFSQSATRQARPMVRAQSFRVKGHTILHCNLML